MTTVPSIEVVRDHVTLAHLRDLASATFGDLVKAVVDVEKGLMAVAGELHSDEEGVLLDQGSRQGALWGINLYPAEFGQPGWLEFDSMINVRPAQGNRSRGVDDPGTRRRIADVVETLVRR